ncbi:serine hydrolase [Terrimonas sp.]|uniref:serine hydrolase n=1 Tax=Terrimonas sp. TaxID=1914338 RepID=UPI000D50FB66|nr:serine hydrolase [Terrimonas sp.]PVD51732.1 serine hydrolase [Terrimonas sp.]
MRIILSFFMLTCFSLNTYSQLTAKAIDDVVERSMKAFDVPGIAVGIIKDGKVVHAKGYGVRSLNTKQKTDENTLFGIASNSKAFTATALGLLVDQGKIKWDDKVRDYIPEFKLYDPYVTEEFTIRDLLTHRSGLGLGAGDLMIFPDSSNFELKDIIHNLRYLKPVSSFRSKYDYDNNLYIIAGEVVARVSGKSWDDFVQQNIIDVIGMTKTATSYNRVKDKTNIIDGHAPVDGKVEAIGRNIFRLGAAAGGLNSNITDLCKWVQLWLNRGKYGDGLSRQLFSENVYREITSPQTIIPVWAPGAYNTHFAAYGLGFFLSDEKGYKRITHTGGLAGVVTQITMFPELNLGIIVLTNQQEGGAFTSITNQIKDSYFGIKGTDRVAEYSANRQKQMASAKQLMDSIWNDIKVVQQSVKEKADFNVYTGTYRDPWFGDVVISVKNGKPWLDSKRSYKLTGEMFYYKGNTFVVKWNDRSMDADAFASFVLDESGKAVGLTMKAIYPLTDFSYDFQDLDFRKVE